MRKQLFALALALIVASALAASASAAIQTFTVQPDQSAGVVLNLSQGDAVIGTVVALGGSSNAINFVVTDPNNNTLVNDPHITAMSFSFQAKTTGAYTLHFDNNLGDNASKTVNVDYYVQPSVLGISAGTILFLVLLIIAIIVVAAVVVALISRSRRHHHHHH